MTLLPSVMLPIAIATPPNMLAKKIGITLLSTTRPIAFPILFAPRLKARNAPLSKTAHPKNFSRNKKGLNADIFA